MAACLIAALPWLPIAPALVSARLVAQAAAAQTTVADTVRNASGNGAQGTLLISWPAFTASNGIAVPQGSTSVTLGAGGAFSVPLVPTVGSTPIGSYYTVVYHLADGTVTREYWQVPASASAVSLQTVRTSVLPSSVAVQTVSKQYVDQAIARAVITGAAPADATPYVQKAGDTMTGPLILSGDPTTPLQAADKSYVDANTTAVQAGLDQKVSKVPNATQIVTQPAGTELRTNRLNGVLYASQFASPAGNDGIANAFASPECGGACTVIVEPDYTGRDSALPPHVGGHLIDQRAGRVSESYFDPPGGGQDIARQTITSFNESSVNSDLFGVSDRTYNTSLGGGNNLLPANLGFSLPYSKSTYTAHDTQYQQFAQGQHVMRTNTIGCYGVGDCIADAFYMRSAGGVRDVADEGAHPYEYQFTEEPSVFTATCTSGCTTGSQSLQLSINSGSGTQSSGRFLIDKAPGKIISTGQLVGGNNGGYPAATAQFTGTSFPASTFFQTSAAIPPQSNNIAPGTVTVALRTSGVPAGFSTSTAASPAGSGVACIADSIVSGASTPENYEMAPFTVVDTTHLQLTLLKPHGPSTIVAIGGLCGYGLEQTIDTYYGIKQVFPVIGSIDAANLYVASAQTPIVGRTQSTSGFANISYPIGSVSRSNGVVTLNLAAGYFSPIDTTGTTMTISGVQDASFNGSFPVSLVAQAQYSYAQSGADAASTGGTIQLLTGGYTLYPMAEVLDVSDPATGTINGKMTLAPNTVAWAASDPVEQPHFFQQRIAADVEYITQYSPRMITDQQAGIYYQGFNGPGLHGFVVRNAAPANSYLGAGGTHAAPDVALQTQGTWNTALDMQAGEQTAIRLRCNGRGCSRFNSTYDLFRLDRTDGGTQFDEVSFAPQSSTMTWNLRGTQYSMSPTAMTVGTLNVTNLNAAHINGASGTTASAATSTSQGTVQLGAMATSSVLANVATSGMASDVSGLAASATTDTTNAANITSGTLALARTPALTGDVTKAAGSGAVVVSGINGGAVSKSSAAVQKLDGVGHLVDAVAGTDFATAAQVAANTSAITANSGNIATNTSGIAASATAIANEVTARQNAIAALGSASAKNAGAAAGNVPVLDANALIPAAELPSTLLLPMKIGTTGLADYPTSGQSSQNPGVTLSYAFNDSNVPSAAAGNGFAHGYADNSIFSRSSANCPTLAAFPAGSGTFAGCAYAAYDARTSYQGANNLNHFVGFQAAGELASNYSGTVNQWSGFLSNPRINGGTLQNAIGFHATNAGVAQGAALYNQYGLYVDPLSASGPAWGAYIAGNNSYFGGKVYFPLQTTTGYGLSFGDELFLHRSNPYTLQYEGNGGNNPVMLYITNTAAPSSSVSYSGFGINLSAGQQLSTFALDSTWPTPNAATGVTYPNSGYIKTNSAMTNGLAFATDAGNAAIRFAPGGTLAGRFSAATFAATHFAGLAGAAAPTAAVGAAAQGCTVSGTDAAMTVNITTGGSPAAGTLCTVTFATAYGSAPRFAAPGATNAASAAAVPNVYAGTSTTTLTISAAAALTASTSYAWNYVLVQ